MSKKIKIKNEKLFLHFTRFPAEQTEEGRKQFFDNQSHGITPDEPDPYYLCLTDGKFRFDIQCSEYHHMYNNGEWWGWYTLWADWEGERWIIPHLCKWHKDIPGWVTDENYDFDKEQNFNEERTDENRLRFLNMKMKKINMMRKKNAT